ncbi:WD repeat-containing protein 46 [Biomphalaria pfeifferi]|uniref:WD repeat-containing protein 46 n=1 Tax=Biomphalaria pfeifferi TaxID=112525 RepID=A0AAD8ASR6_BIOPF|nr:WD repeat-containing protein 46 [Biomphalaria pfeifferi]
MANKSSVSRKNSYVWLIGYPKEAILGARLPSGRDAMRTFFFYHKSSKMTVGESARLTFEAVQSFWLKSRLPIRKQQHCIEKIKDLYNEHRQLVKNRKRNSDSDGLKQKQYSIKLDQLLDISHSSAAQMINNEEDRQFLKLQQQSRAGCIGTVDKKLAAKEKRSLERRKRYNEWAISVKKQTTKEDGFCLATSSNNDDDTDVEDLDDDNEFIIKQSSRAGKKQCKRRRVISSKVSAVLDRTNTSTRAATMILASAFNEAGSSTSTVVLSKSTVHRQRQQRRKVAALEIKTTYVPSISVVHWDGKLIPDLCHTTTSISDRLAILLSSLNDGNVKLLGVPKLQSGSGQAAANAVVDNLKSWSCESQIIVVSDTVKAFISKELQQKQLREDYRELIALAARAVGLDVSEPIRKPGAIHRARWMA